MKEKDPKNKSAKSHERIANKPTHEQAVRLLASFKEMLSGECLAHIRGYEHNRNRFGDPQVEAKILDQILRLFGKFDSISKRLSSTPSGAHIRTFQIEASVYWDRLKEDLGHRLEEMRLGLQVKRARPSMKHQHGRLAFLILLYLEAAMGDRILVDAMGKFIQVGGELQQKLDKAKRGAFDSFRFPSVSPSEPRWERSPKESLNVAALRHIERMYPGTDPRRKLNEVIQEGALRLRHPKKVEGGSESKVESLDGKTDRIKKNRRTKKRNS